MLYSRSFLPIGATVLSIASSVSAYSLVATYDSTNFFDSFNFFTGTDPTNGDVDYVAQDVAEAASLVYYENNQIYLGVDSTTYNPSGGRESVSTLPTRLHE